MPSTVIPLFIILQMKLYLQGTYILYLYHFSGIFLFLF